GDIADATDLAAGLRQTLFAKAFCTSSVESVVKVTCTNEWQPRGAEFRVLGAVSISDFENPITYQIGGLGANGIEVHEPRLEESPRDRFQRLVHTAVQFDLVVQRAKDVGDGTLFVKARKCQ